MRPRLRALVQPVYERVLAWDISETPDHVAVIQDGNRRYARKRGKNDTDGHHDGAETTESLLQWCEDVGVEELTLYTFSTENFDRPAEQREALFDLIEAKLSEFADHERVHEDEVRIRAIGETDMLPQRVRAAIRYADEITRGYDGRYLNVALAYGGRAELLSAARDVAHAVDDGRLAPEDVDVDCVADRLYEGPTQAVDLILRTGGDERTSNFLPWHANGNEAAVYFCAPYWPEFRKIDFLRAIRTYGNRKATHRRNRAERALALVRKYGASEAREARRILDRFSDALPRPAVADAEGDAGVPDGGLRGEDGSVGEDDGVAGD